MPAFPGNCVTSIEERRECFLKYRYIIGIDLGTTNSAVAYVDLQSPANTTGARAIQRFPIPQLVAAGEVARRSMLPSFLYLPGAYDLPPGSTALPWAADRDYAVGEFAREQGALVAGRLVSSAKSWLSHAGVDRTAPILPWGAKADVPKVSPVEASARYLQHLGEAWNAVMALTDDGARFEDQLMILTVPASFDEVARELTLTAAEKAGIAHAILLEEPLAAFYAWLSTHESDWQTTMHAGQLILVCDVGGGTTDFSIIGVQGGEQGLRFNRLAVGDHLMLGGDNIDITLARYVERQLAGKAGKVEAQHWHQLVAQCRKAKETLLNLPAAVDGEVEAKVDVTVVGTGSSLIAGTRKGTLTQNDVQQVILDGFFPEIALLPATDPVRRSGLAEFGLPYVQDPAITRHLATFWQRFPGLLKSETGRSAVYPDFLLFNGGALIPQRLRTRLQMLIQQWFQPVAGDDWLPVELENPNPELAVALGAAYYGLVRLGEGVRVGSGSPRAYYIGVDTGAPPAANRSAESTQAAVCVAARGAEEGFTLHLREPQFEALTNQPVSFYMFSSSTRLGDRPGEIVQLAGDEISQLPPIRTVLRYGRKGLAQRIPVQLAVHLTAVGTLELWCESQQTNHRWQLRFDVRQPLEAQLTDTPNADDAPVVATIAPTAVANAQAIIRKTFHASGEERKRYPSEALRKNLEETLDLPKEDWPLPLLRTLADTFLEVGDQRKLSADHEARWFNMLGFCLRPGFGDALDEWRMKEVWKLQLQGLSFARQIQNRAEWWVFWQRVAGGLTMGQQQQIYQAARAYLPSAKKQKKAKTQFGGYLGTGEELEFWMMLANLEWLSPEVKTEVGRELWQKWKKGKPHPKELWALSRIGARTPMYGPLDRLLPSAEAATWLEKLLALNLEPTKGAANALVLLARFTDDRSRDIPEALRERVATWLTQRAATAHFLDLLLNPAGVLDQAEQEWMFGEALPVGLSLFNK